MRPFCESLTFLFNVYKRFYSCHVFNVFYFNINVFTSMMLWAAS